MRKQKEIIEFRDKSIKSYGRLIAPLRRLFNQQVRALDWVLSTEKEWKIRRAKETRVWDAFWFIVSAVCFLGGYWIFLILSMPIGIGLMIFFGVVVLMSKMDYDRSCDKLAALEGDKRR